MRGAAREPEGTEEAKRKPRKATGRDTTWIVELRRVVPLGVVSVPAEPWMFPIKHAGRRTLCKWLSARTLDLRVLFFFFKKKKKKKKNNKKKINIYIHIHTYIYILYNNNNNIFSTLYLFSAVQISRHWAPRQLFARPWVPTYHRPFLDYRARGNVGVFPTGKEPSCCSE